MPEVLPARVIPTDVRAPTTGEVAALPIWGGTLLLTPDGTQAIAADPERDRVSVVDVFSEQLVQTIELVAGDAPFRLALDHAGRVHVVARGKDQLLTLDLAASVVIGRRDVCRAARGLAYDASSDVLHVACASGALWTLSADPALVDPVRVIALPTDLRDVLVSGDRLWVTRFHSAELIELDRAGAIVSTRTPNATRSSRSVRATEVLTPRFVPNGAVRTIVGPEGQPLMLHQRALAEPIKLDPDMPPSLNGYYDGSCGGIVEPAITRFLDDGATVTTGGLPGSVAVDVSAGLGDPADPAQGLAAVAFAGGPDPDAPTASGALGRSAFAISVIAHTAPGNGSRAAPDQEPSTGCAAVSARETQGQIVAVAQRADGAVLVGLSREPAQLEILAKPGGSTQPIIPLGGGSARDSGHDLFYRSPVGGVSCASCHLEGGDDGHVWRFDPIGPRRTQAVDVDLAGTEPFHWDGDLPDLESLLEEVMVVRMGGVHQSKERIGALADFIFALRPAEPIVAEGDPAALRGKALFESAEVGCAECHAGPALTSRESRDVGTGGMLQVPSLLGVGYRTTLMHDGCASSLRERFDPECGGGEQHGHTSALGEPELDDLIAYLRSL